MTSVADPSLIASPFPDDLSLYDDDNFEFTFDDFDVPITDDFLNSDFNYDPELNEIVSDPDTVANSSLNCTDVSGFLNFPSPDENSSPELGNSNSGGERFPVSSQGSVSKVSSPESGTNSVVDQKVKCELGNNGCVLKLRKIPQL